MRRRRVKERRGYEREGEEEREKERTAANHSAYIVDFSPTSSCSCIRVRFTSLRDGEGRD
jgi:hypothetical protein